MTEVKTIAGALAKAQLSMTGAVKGSSNPHLRSKYADLGNVMDACLPALNENDIALLQPVGRDDGGDYVETMFVHSSGESLSCKVYLLIGKKDMQGLGSAITYARRYGLMSMAGIAPEDDDGHEAAKNPAPQKREQQKPAEKPPEPTPAEIRDELKAGFHKAGPAKLSKLWATNDALKAKVAALPPEMQVELKSLRDELCADLDAGAGA